MSKPYPSYKDSGVESLGKMPEHWAVKPLKALASLNDETLAENTDAEYEIEYVDIGSVTLTDGIQKTETFLFKDAPSRARRLVKDGDVLVSTVRTYLKAIAPVENPASNLIASTGFAVVRPGENFSSRFARYVLQAPSFLEEVIARSTGVSYPAINASDMARILLPAPPITEQSSIAAFLDHETAKIDALVEEQRRLIELLKEKRQAVISHAVTKGLNPNAPMKDSGIEWLGEVPEHWRVLPLSRVTLDKCDGPFGSNLKSEHYTENGVRVIRLQNIRQGWFDDSDAAFVGEEYHLQQLQGHDVREGDVLIAGLGDERNSVGRACVAPADLGPAIVKADCFRFRLDQKNAFPDFIAMQLTAGSVADAGLMSTGSTRSRIPLSLMSNRKIALPPLTEQNAISYSVRTMSGGLDRLIDEAARGTELLNERRTALISAFVTGKIDVRGFVQQPAELELA